MSKLGIKINQDFAFSRFMMRGKKAQVIFFPGCAFMKLGYDLSNQVLSLIKRVYDTAEICSLCCSNPSQVLDKEYHSKKKKKLVDFLIDRGAKKVYTACPNCYKMLKIIFKEYDLRVEVLMVYDLISEVIDDVSEHHEIDERVVLHDPCVMRNESGTQDTVRYILDKISQEYVETSNNKIKTICCGNINMLHVIKPRQSSLIRKKRVEELKNGADVICSYCNGCLNAFAKEKVKVIHLLELVFGKAKSNSYLNRLKMTMKLKKV